MTVTEFANRIDCSLSMASRILSGKRAPGLRLIRKIHAEFDIPLGALVDAQVEPARFGRLIRDRLKIA